MTVMKLAGRKRALALVGAAAAAALVLTSCSSGGGDTKNAGPVEWELTEQTAAPSGDIDQITWASYAEPFTLDYVYAFDYADNQVLSNVCESLLRLNPDFHGHPGARRVVREQDAHHVGLPDS